MFMVKLTFLTQKNKAFYMPLWLLGARKIQKGDVMTAPVKI